MEHSGNDHCFNQQLEINDNLGGKAITPKSIIDILRDNFGYYCNDHTRTYENYINFVLTVNWTVQPLRIEFIILPLI